MLNIALYVIVNLTLFLALFFSGYFLGLRVTAAKYKAREDKIKEGLLDFFRKIYINSSTEAVYQKILEEGPVHSGPDNLGH